MTLKQAIEILNREKHREWDGWDLNGDPSIPATFVRGGDRYDWLEQFEAIAIAEKYEREKPAEPTGIYENPPDSKARRIAGLIHGKTVGRGVTTFQGLKRALEEIKADVEGEKKAAENEAEPT